MTRGYADWGQSSGGVSDNQLKDMAELASRLGSISTFDRRGYVYLADDFEHNIKNWVLTIISGTGTAYLSTARSRFKTFSMELVPTDGTTSEIEMARSLPTLREGLVGFEIAVSFGDIPDHFDFIIRWQRLSPQLSYHIRVEVNNQRIQYRDASGIFITLENNIDIDAGYGKFHVLKLVIDTVNNFYRRVVWNKTEYDMKNIAPSTDGATIGPAPRIALRTKAAAFASGMVWVDALVVTINEPG